MAMDLRSLILCLVIVTVTLTLCMLYFLSERKTYPGFLNWTLSFFLFSAGIVFIGLREFLSDFVSIVLGNVLISSAGIVFYSGFAAFVQKKINLYIHLAAFVIHAFCVSFFTYIIPSLLVRIILVSLLIILYFLLILRILSRDIRPILGKASPLLAATLTAFVLFLGLRTMSS